MWTAFLKSMVEELIFLGFEYVYNIFKHNSSALQGTDLIVFQKVKL